MKCSCGVYLPPGFKCCDWFEYSEHFKRSAAEREAKRLSRISETRVEERHEETVGPTVGKTKFVVLMKDRELLQGEILL